MSKNYRSFINKHKYSRFTRKQSVTAAVSFSSNKVLDKKYSEFFNKMTVGYECEISVDTEGVEVEIDEQRLAAEFEETFSYSKDSFLYKLSNAHKIPDVLDMFDITPVYGMPDIENIKQIGTLIKPLLTGYKVVGLPMKDGSAILEEPNIDDYRGYSRHNLEKFSLDDTRLINVPLALNKAKEILNTMLNIHEMYPVTSNNNFQADTAITNALVLIQACVKNLEGIVLSNEANEILARKAIYTIGEHRFRYVKAWEELLKIMNINTGQSANFIVFDEERNLNILNSTKYDESYGLLSPLLEWSEDGKEHFEEEFNEEYRIKYDDAWADHLADAMSGESKDSDESLKHIYNLVVKEVDGEAKLVNSYHGAEQYKGRFTVVEPDSSIKPEGAEVVSKVFVGVKKSLVWLDDVFTMIEENDELSTNQSTGLHVNIGTFKALHIAADDDKTINQTKPVIDVLKLAVLSGDHYLLEQFGRFGNSFAKSLASNIRDLVNTGVGSDFKTAVREDLQKSLVKLNRSFVYGQAAGDESRYRTINMQHLVDKGYLEFRIAGGINYHADRNRAHKAIYRYAQLCAVACDPDAYFKEYMIELYKRFVDSAGPLPSPALATKEPRPKNVQEAMYYLRQWSSSQYSAGKEGLDRQALNTLRDFVATNGNPNQATVLDTLAGLNAEHYKNVTNNLLYAYRVLMLYTVRDKPNPKQYLATLFKEQEKGIKDYGAPKLYKNKPQWVRYFYTGSFTSATPKELMATEDDFIKRINPEGKHVPDRDRPNLGPGDMYGMLPKGAKLIQSKTYSDFGDVKFYNYKGDIYAMSFNPDLGEIDVIGYSLNIDNKETELHLIDTAHGKGIGQELDYLYRKQNPYAPTGGLTKAGEKAARKTYQRLVKERVIEAMTEIKAADGEYTNKSKSVKVIYYANRSTPQVCKPGQTVKAKAGYGKRTKIRSATPEEVKQFKQGKWLRTREDGKSHSDKGSKTSKYRPQLAKKQKDARKRKLAASEGIKYNDFIDEVFGRSSD